MGAVRISCRTESTARRSASKPGLDGLQLPLYHRSEVLLAAREFRTIFLVEGEGKADLLRASLAESRTSGAVTTVPHGANARMRDAHVADFVGAGRVIVVADSDTVGRAAARTRARSSHERTKRPKSVLWIFSPIATTATRR